MRFIYVVFFCFIFIRVSYARMADDTLVTRDIDAARRLINAAMPGDTVFLQGGVYFVQNESLAPLVSGTAAAWITIMPQPGQEVILDGSAYLNTLEKAGNQGHPHKGTVTFENVRYLRMQGIKVRQSHAIGILINGRNTSHIELIDCKVEGSYNSGIGLWYADSCRVNRCEITGANNQALRPEGTPLRGEAPHEALTIAGATHFEVAQNLVHDGFKEGIDCKEVSSYGIIHHNTVYNMPRQGLYVDCWFGRLHNIEFAYNKAYNCEWGFAISAEGKDATMDSIFAHHNLLFDNRGSGILFGVWGVDGPRKHIYIYNNTITRNGKKAHWSGLTGGIHIMTSNLADVHIYNNISASNYGYAIAASVQPAELHSYLKRQNIRINNNLEWQPVKAEQEISKGIFKTVYPFSGDKAIQENPALVNLSGKNLGAGTFPPE